MDDKKLEQAYWLTIENAESLIKEATVLKNVGFFARAYSLCHLAIEELGKSSIIYNSIIEYYNGAKIDLKTLKENGFEDHNDKIDLSLRIELAGVLVYEQNKDVKTGLAEEVFKEFNKIKQLNSLKNQSLYVCYNGNKFVSPSQTITEQMVNDIEYNAKIRCQISRQMFGTLDTIKNVAKKLKEILNDPVKLKEWEEKAFKKYRQ